MAEILKQSTIYINGVIAAWPQSFGSLINFESFFTVTIMKKKKSKNLFIVSYQCSSLNFSFLAP